jgi:hypothetical protein
VLFHVGDGFISDLGTLVPETRGSMSKGLRAGEQIEDDLQEVGDAWSLAIQGEGTYPPRQEFLDAYNLGWCQEVIFIDVNLVQHLELVLR